MDAVTFAHLAKIAQLAAYAVLDCPKCGVRSQD
jgi:hypothetical protein